MVSILADHQFTLLDFENIKNEYTIQELDKSVINIINQIATRVGAPNYQKTPIFKKKIGDNSIKKPKIIMWVMMIILKRQNWKKTKKVLKPK